MNKENKTSDKHENGNDFIADVSGSLSFKEQLLNDFIPRIEAMAEKEKAHLHYLIDNEAPTEFIQMSQKTHFHFLEKIKEYKEYAERL